MECIEQDPHPLVFKLADPEKLPLKAANTGKRMHYRTATRALAGMQKEALVFDGRNNECWRLFCDEGPWLNGSDLAPFPLGFFSAGLAASYQSEFLSHARQANIEVRQLQVMVDNFYTMEGSLMRGTMTGSALPVEVTFAADTNASSEDHQRLAHLAVASSPADAYLRNAVDSLFSLNHNSKARPVADVAASSAPAQAAPDALFPMSTPGTGTFAGDILERLDAEDGLGGEQLGTERSSVVGLSDNQKRQVHVRAVGRLREDGLKELKVACFQPIGSVFQLLSDDSQAAGGQGRAPSGLALLSAGISFCFMTQLGRYAHVAKHDMQSYQIIQDTSFSQPTAVSPAREAATTHSL